MKLFSLLTLLFLIAAKLNAQTPFDLNKFKFRHQSYKGLDLGISLFQQGSASKNNSDNKMQFNGNLNFFSFVNTNRMQNTSRVSFSIIPSLTSNHDQRVVQLNSNLSLNVVHRMYNAENKFYGFEISLIDVLNASRTSAFIPEKVFRNSKTLINNNGLAMLIAGKGRAEYISEAVIALRLFEELKLKNLLLREVYTDDVSEFSNLIISYNNKRVYDFRLNKIEMIEAMINFLKTNHLINECNALTFAILNDQIYFATNIMRFSGKTNQIGAGIAVNNLANKTRTDSNLLENFNNYLTPQLVYTFMRYHPLNVKNQIDKGISVGIADLITNHGYFIGSSVMRTKEPQLILSAFWIQGYYPNTRTYITWTNRISSETGRATTPGLVTRISTNNSVSTALTLYYYFSPQLRITVNENLSYAFNGDFYKNYPSYKYSTFRNYLTAGFTYALY